MLATPGCNNDEKHWPCGILCAGPKIVPARVLKMDAVDLLEGKSIPTRTDF